MDLAVSAARKAQGDASTPRVGAVAVSKGAHLATAFRGEVQPGEHAEFTLLERHLKDICLAGATVFTTLEPCTTRNPPKRPCVERLIQRKVSRVVIGMLDPNPLVRGLGCRLLRQANVTFDLFPCEVMSQLEDLNRDFIRHMEANPTHLVTDEIADLACRSGTPRQREAVGVTIGDCMAALQRINRGEIQIRGREAGYFKRLLEAIDQADGPEHIRAFIRLTAFKPEELYSASWFERFYEALEDRVRRKRVSLEYVFLVHELPLVDAEREFLAMYERFADRVTDLRVT